MAVIVIEITFTVLEETGAVQFHFVNNPGRTGGALQVYDRDLGWRNVANFHDSHVWAHGLRVVQDTTADGWRNVFRSPKPDPYRIAALGCSFTYGFGVSNQDTYCAALHGMLDGSRGDIELINTGVNGYGVDQFVLSYETRVRQLHPDLVLLQLGWFDALRAKYDTMWSTPKPRFVLRDGELQLTNHPVPKKRFAGVERWLLGWSATYRFMKETWLARANKQVLDSRAKTWNDVELRELVVALLRRLKEDTERDGVDLVAFYWIDSGPMREGGDWPARWCRDAGIEVFKIEDQADEQAWRRLGLLDYPPPVMHWTPLGHRYVATAIAHYLRQSGRVSGSQPLPLEVASPSPSTGPHARPEAVRTPPDSSGDGDPADW